MKLTSLGRSYAATLPAIETTETQENLTFLGKCYQRKEFPVSQRQHPVSELTYREARYVR